MTSQTESETQAPAELSADGVKGLKPHGKYVLIRQDQPAEKTEGGLILVHAAQEMPLTGEILAVGAGVDEPEIRAGMTAYWDWQKTLGGKEYTHNGEAFKLIHQDELLVVEAR